MKTRHLISMLLVMLFGCASLGVYFTWQYQLPSKVITKVGDADISQHALSLRLRELVWRHGKGWDQLSSTEQSSLRLDATNDLVDQQLLKQWSTKNPAMATATQTEHDFQQFLKQFESPDGWQERAEMQGLNEPQLRQMLAEESGQQAALEAYLVESARVTDEEAQIWFLGHQQEMHIPECVRVNHIFLSGHDKKKPDRTAEINAIYQRLIQKEVEFSELAAKFSEDDRSNKKDGDLEWFTRNRVPKEFAEIVFSLSPNEISKPFQTPLGWHIVWMRERLAPRLPLFTEVRTEISAMLESQKREALLQKLMQELRENARIIRNKRLIQATPPAQ